VMLVTQMFLILKVFQSQKQSPNLSGTQGVITPSAPPGTPSLDMMRKYHYIPSMSDNMVSEFNRLFGGVPRHSAVFRGVPQARSGSIFFLFLFTSVIVCSWLDFSLPSRCSYVVWCH